jgi:hypothetical protein
MNLGDRGPEGLRRKWSGGCRTVKDRFRYAPSERQSDSDAFPAAHFDRYERHVISGQETRNTSKNRHQLRYFEEAEQKSVDM